MLDMWMEQFALCTLGEVADLSIPPPASTTAHNVSFYKYSAYSANGSSTYYTAEPPRRLIAVHCRDDKKLS